MKKRLLILLTGVLLVLAFSVGAGAVERLLVEDAVEDIIDNDLSLKLDALEPSLSVLAQSYQSDFAADLIRIKEDTWDYQDQQAKFQAEIRANDALYSYWLARESLNVTQQSLNQAEANLKIIDLKEKQGLASKADVLRAEVEVNKAKATYQDSYLGVRLKKYQVNQGLENSLEKDLQIAVPKFTLEADYSPGRTTNHDYLSLTEKRIEAYENIIKEIDRVRRLETTPPAKSLAYAELKSYYDELLDDAKIQLELQEDELELISYSLKAQLDNLEEKYHLAKENLAKSQELYAKANMQFEVGLITATDLERLAGLPVSQAKLQYLSVQKDYYVLQGKLKLFRDGYKPPLAP